MEQIDKLGKRENVLTAHISDDGQSREESVAEHTQKTAFLCSEKGGRCGLSNIMSFCGIFHDMGKNKQKFYDYIHADEKTRKQLRGSIAHASTGAKYIYDKYHDCSDNTRYMVEMISYAIAAHHGLFDCVDEKRTDVFSKKLSDVDDYDEACYNAEKDYLSEYEIDKIFTSALDEFTLIWNKLKELCMKLKPLLPTGYSNEKKQKIFSDFKFFLLASLQRLILSILIDSDWEATSDFMAGINTLSKQPAFDTREIFNKARENFDVYMQKKQNGIHGFELTEKEREILDARNSLQKECRQFAEYPAGIYRMPIPTGGGKTLSSLAYVLEYCRRHPKTERVVYVSPYISITEQNAQIFCAAIGNNQWILEHHSSVVKNEETEEENYQFGKLSRYDMNWEEPFICTTFVQFMNTLFSDKSESVRRLHRLVNAVVIIDEVQSMPLKCVHSFNCMINFLNMVCNTNIILCTATQPTLAQAEYPIFYSTPKDMIKNVADWYQKFERVKIHMPHMGQKHTFESLGSEIAEQTERYQSILVVLNTKSAVRRLYDIVKARNISVEYLTTNLCAEHRSDRICSIKEMLKEKKEKIVVISTNLIEAGVDISFECVYRSMTGLDSLAQSAGRCNRSGEMDQEGMVYLIELEGENIGNMEELQQNSRVTRSVMFQYNQDGNTDSLLMPKWMDQYYEGIYCSASDKMNFPVKASDTSIMELLSRGFDHGEGRNFMNQAYKTAGQEYRVIEEHSFGVIVPYKKGAELIEAIQREPDMADIKAYIRQAQRYTVNVRENQLKKLEGLIQPVSDAMPGLYMVAAPGAYSNAYGIVPEWETLIF